MYVMIINASSIIVYLKHSVYHFEIAAPHASNSAEHSSATQALVGTESPPRPCKIASKTMQKLTN